jgi:hypothetical protein
MPQRPKPRWRDRSPASRCVLVVVALVQLALAGAAWTDLARRPAAEVRGPKWRWGLAVLVNFVGPLAYFRWGRIRPPVPPVPPEPAPPPAPRP